MKNYAELVGIDWQINQRLYAEQVIRETRDALNALLGDIREREEAER